ncbi:MAG TPA: flagellar biosynthesis protein FlhB [Nitrospiraceae bacterium]|nr:flagellar biosynthesis protein FlhB [Nitrospiraceae bacterium]
MAENAADRTERATPKKKADARRKGQIAFSRDAVMAFGLLGSVGALFWLGPTLFGDLKHSLRGWLSRIMEESAHRSLTVDHLHLILRDVGVEVFLILGPVIGGIAVVGIGANIVQTGFLWRQDGLAWDLARINPLGGFSRLFSIRAFVELIKSWLKILAIGGMGYLAIRDDMGQLPALTHFGVEPLLIAVGAELLKASLMMGGAAAVIGVLDYGYQRYEWERSLRMSKEEIKEEHRAAEGDPQLRSKLRSVQKELARKRMMAAVPKADVIVTNPTHLAVALRYDPATMGAPVVVAKGAGYVAEKIREIGRHHGVMIVENKLMARTLYKLVEVGHQVPEDLYRAVAEILAFVYRVRGKLPQA